MDKISKYHKILELTHPIKEGDVKRAFRRLSLLHHPDRGGNNQRFQEINEAYTFLSNPENIIQHEVHEMPVDSLFNNIFRTNMNNNTNSSPANIFSQMFNIAPKKQPSQENNIFSSFMGLGGSNNFIEPEVFFMPGISPNCNMNIGSMMQETIESSIEPIYKTVHITIRDAYNGCNIKLSFSRKVQNFQEIGIEDETINVVIPEGVENEEEIMIRNKGNKTLNAYGRIYVKILIDNNSVHTKEDLNLIYKQTITLYQAYNCFKFNLEHLNNKTYVINQSNNDLIIQNGYRKVIQGLGFKRDGTIGNLIIEFNIFIPTNTSNTNFKDFKKILHAMYHESETIKPETVEA